MTLRGGKVQTIYYFSRDDRPETGSDLPSDVVVRENPRNGFLTLKRTQVRHRVDEGDVVTTLPDEAELGLAIAPDSLGVTYIDNSDRKRVEAPDGAVYELRRVYVASLLGSEACIERLERLIRSESAPEAAFQETLEDCPEFVRIFGHRDAVPQVCLEGVGTKGDLIPDFALRPVTGDLCDLLEIKKPSLRFLVGTDDQPELYHRLRDAVGQLHHYAEALDDPVVRTRVSERYQLEFFRPRLYLIAGRDPVDRTRLKRALHNDARTEIITWDEVIARARDRRA